MSIAKYCAIPALIAASIGCGIEPAVEPTAKTTQLRIEQVTIEHSPAYGGGRYFKPEFDSIKINAVREGTLQTYFIQRSGRLCTQSMRRIATLRGRTLDATIYKDRYGEKLIQLEGQNLPGCWGGEPGPYGLERFIIEREPILPSGASIATQDVSGSSISYVSTTGRTSGGEMRTYTLQVESASLATSICSRAQSAINEQRHIIVKQRKYWQGFSEVVDFETDHHENSRTVEGMRPEVVR
jgi:hypothetical protein